MSQCRAPKPELLQSLLKRLPAASKAAKIAANGHGYGHENGMATSLQNGVAHTNGKSNGVACGVAHSAAHGVANGTALVPAGKQPAKPAGSLEEQVRKCTKSIGAPFRATWHTFCACKLWVGTISLHLRKTNQRLKLAAKTRSAYARPAREASSTQTKAARGCDSSGRRWQGC